jgi:beta-galactosidase
MEHILEVMPSGYTLQELDECSAIERQPHVAQKVFRTFPQPEVDANFAERTVTCDRTRITASYAGLRSGIAYVLTVRYATGPLPQRIQSLWSGDVLLHGPRVLHAGFSERFIIEVPPAAVRGGTLALEFRKEGEGDVVLGSLELWAPLPPANMLRILQVESLFADLRGQVADLRFAPLAGARVEVAGSRGSAAETTTGPDGRFRFDRAIVQGLARAGDVRVTATWHGSSGSLVLTPRDVLFEPVRYRPIPVHVDGLASHRIDLCGEWRIRPGAEESAVGTDLAGWGALRVPGQFAQQGYDIADDELVAVAREFSVPAEWKGRRVFVRFDAIHGGVRYWLNGRALGTSENLFTPVEWDITAALRFGEQNRIDLLMRLATTSERLSYSSGYAFHPLGGIDRAVHLYALPTVAVRDLHLAVDFDPGHRHGTLDLSVGVDNATVKAADVSIGLELAAPDGRPIALSEATRQAAAPAGASVALTLGARIPDVEPWSAEKPRLYRLSITLQAGGRVLERIERAIGFRRVEVRDGQLYLNGRTIKLAGACHHELHPLTGRADTMQWAERDVLLAKGANLNYLRTSHYPPTQEFLDAADRLGLYVECEAPLCWVRERELDVPLAEVLTPTAAMIDYHHGHASIVLWSLANESHFKQFFKASHRLCKELDPTRPTTFNDPDPERVCDIANLHYPPMPYDEQLKGDPRPILLGEYFFPLCHEQTDMRVDPGLRELWGHGHADPDSAWAKRCARSFDGSFLHPGALPGTWTHIVRSRRVIGGAIWALLDEPFYLPKSRKAGYAWVHGAWGLLDGWRRPKPEWWLAKLVFSPVWFPRREVEYRSGQASVRIPLENRYSFTDLSELELRWEIDGGKGTATAGIPPGTTGSVEITLPKGTAEGSRLALRAFDRAGEIVSAALITLGSAAPHVLKRPGDGCPTWKDRDGVITVTGRGYSLPLDRATLRCLPAAPGSTMAVEAFPVLHLTRIDLADLVHPRAAPYAVLPDVDTRRIERVEVGETASGLEITVRDSFDGFAGSLSWLLDGRGMGRIRFRYTYSGPALGVREIGVRIPLRPDCVELAWKRWSEWGELPEDHIGRTEGRAGARRPAAMGRGREDLAPTWPWALDQNELGTNDFRGVKFCVTEATLAGPSGGVRVHANADVHVRACIDAKTNGVLLHLLSECGLGQVRLAAGTVLSGEFLVELLAP